MTGDSGSSDGGGAAEPPEREADEGLRRHSGLAGKLAANARGRLRSFANMRHSLGVRLLNSVLLFSACVTLILTLVQLYLGYRSDVSVLELQLQQISNSYLDSIAEGLWTLDEKQVRLQLTGILRLPAIRAVEVREARTAGNPLVMRLGEKSVSSALTREYPLHYNVQGQNMQIGTLWVRASLADVYHRALNAALVILVSQAATIFFVSLFIVYIFHQLVTRHLFAIASYVDSYRISDPPSPLRLRRPPGRQEDELQRVVTAFNTLSDDLQIAYRSVRDVNQQLAQDVAARRQAEAVLREREARIRRLIEANIIGIFIFTSEGRIIEANDAFLKMVGYGHEDIASGRIRWTDLTPPEVLDREAPLIQERKITGRLQPFEKEYFRKDGSRVPVLIGVASFEEGRDDGVAFVVDLTERKRAEEALRQSEERFRTLVQFSFDVYWESDAQHRFIRQEFAEGLADVPALGSEIGKTRWEVPYLEPDAEAWRKHRETLDAHLPFRDFELARPAPDGGKRYVSVSGLPVFDETGRFVGYRGVGRHITERKRAEQTLHDVQTELAHANRIAAMGQLTASIAHEITQPIAATVTNAQAALRWLDVPDLEEVRRALGRIVNDGSLAGEIIGRVRGLAKKAPPRKEALAINEAILEVIALLRGEVVKHGISVQAQLVEGLPLIHGDRVQLQQVILNLIINAVEAMSGVSEGARDLLISTARAEPDGVLVAMRDSGPGLAPTTRERLFDPFFTTKPGGLGLGLSICRSIIEAHGGRLWASTNEPRGAVLQFNLPAGRDQTAPAEQVGQFPVV